MEHPPSILDYELPLEVLQVIDEICIAFEQTMEEGKAPRIEEFMERLAACYRDTSPHGSHGSTFFPAETESVATQRLFYDLLDLEVSFRRRQGENPVSGPYLDRFPDYSRLVLDQLPDEVSTEARLETQRPRGLQQQPVTARPGDRGRDTAQRFRVLRPHERGGLGQVSVAWDEELHRKVALKEILPSRAEDVACCRRFEREAEIAGGLEHPGIVPVHGRGHFDDGRPFYVMRFVEGESLSKGIKRFYSYNSQQRRRGELRVEFLGLLNRFLDVCHTIAYAHDRGYLHRDIKPGNIMLGRYGETLLVDWGLAKSRGEAVSPEPDETEPHRPGIEEAVEPTREGTVQGTPAFMSPEQAAGRVDAIRPSSDIYSLGATLFALITGKAPHADCAVEAAVRRVAGGQVPRPSSVRRRIPRALEAICVKAMATRPERRYASAKALADDLERYLADEPVTALRERPHERLRRWTRRYPSLFSGLVVCIVLAVVFLGVLLLKNRELHEANRDLRMAGAVIQQSRLRAEARGEETLGLLSRLLSRVQGELVNQPGADRARLAILRELYTGLSEVAAQLDERTGTTRHELEIHTALGDIYAQVRGFVPQNPEIAEDPSEEVEASRLARHHYEQAIRIAERLQSQSPGDSELKVILGDASLRLARLALEQGAYDEAQERAERTLRIARRLVETSPGSAEHLHLQASALTALGDLEYEIGDYPQAQERYTLALKNYREVHSLGSDDMDTRRLLSVALTDVGEVLGKRGRYDKAEFYYRQALKLDRSLLAETPDDPEILGFLSSDYDSLGVLAYQQDHLDTALYWFEQAWDIDERLLQRDPHNSWLQQQVSVACGRLGDVLVEMGEWERAREHLERGLEFDEILARENPGDVIIQYNLSVAYDSLGVLAREMGEREVAEDYFLRAVAVDEQQVERHPESADNRLSRCQGHLQLGGFYYEQFRMTECLEHLEAAARYADYVVPRIEADPEGVLLVVEVQRQLGEAFQRTGDLFQARQAYREAMRLLDQLRAYSDVSLESVEIYQHAAIMELAGNQPAEASRLLQEAIDILVRVAAEVDDPEEVLEFAAYLRDFQSLAGFDLQDPAHLDFARSPEDGSGGILLMVRGMMLLHAMENQPDGVPRDEWCDRVAETAEALRGHAQHDADDLYNAACFYARAAAGLSTDGAAGDARYNAWCEEAVACLRASFRAGFDDEVLYLFDPDLDEIRTRVDFPELDLGGDPFQ